MANFKLKLKAGTGGVSPPVDPRAYLSSGAKDMINNTIMPGLTTRWAGAVEAPTVTLTATSAADLSSKIFSSNVSQKTLILLSSSGDWSTTSATVIEVKNKNYKANGGWLRIEPETGSGPVIEGILDIIGSTHVHINNITSSGGINIRIVGVAQTRPIVKVENCRIGHYYAGLSDPTQYVAQGVRTSETEEIQVLNCKFRRVGCGVQLDATRRSFVYNNDMQEWNTDGFRLTGVDADFGNGQTIATLYPGDVFMYAHIAKNTIWNTSDDPSLYLEHTDSLDFQDPTDNVGYKVLIEYNVIYGNRYQSTQGATTNVIAGIQFNNSMMECRVVSHSNFVIFGGYNSQYQGTGTFYLENETFGRCADMPGTIDYYNQYAVVRDPVTTFNIRRSIANAVITATGSGGTLNVEELTVANPRVGATVGQRYSDVFNGTFTTDGAGRLTYTNVVDDGAYTQDELRSAVWSVFSPKAGFTTTGAPNPSTWPTIT